MIYRVEGLKTHLCNRNHKTIDQNNYLVNQFPLERISIILTWPVRDAWPVSEIVSLFHEPVEMGIFIWYHCQWCPPSVNEWIKTAFILRKIIRGYTGKHFAYIPLASRTNWLSQASGFFSKPDFFFRLISNLLHLTLVWNGSVLSVLCGKQSPAEVDKKVQLAFPVIGSSCFSKERNQQVNISIFQEILNNQYLFFIIFQIIHWIESSWWK